MVHRPPAASKRGLCLAAITDGHVTRETILAYIAESEDAKSASPPHTRKRLIKTLTNERDGRVAEPLWSYDGEEYALTDAGIALRDGGDDEEEEGEEEEGEEEEVQNDDEDDGGEEDEEEEQTTSTQLKLVLGSVRWHIHRALCAGISERSDIVQHVVSISARPFTSLRLFSRQTSSVCFGCVSRSARAHTFDAARCPAQARSATSSSPSSARRRSSDAVRSGRRRAVHTV